MQFRPFQSRQWPGVALAGAGRRMALAGSLTILLYGCLTVMYPLKAGVQVPHTFWAAMMQHALLVGALHTLIYAALAACYVWALHVALRQGDQAASLPSRHSIMPVHHVRGIIVGVWLIVLLVLSGIYPGESTDIFDYLFRGRMLAELGASPLAVDPSGYKDQPFYAYVFWRHNVDTYGPLWEYASAATAAIVGAIAASPAQAPGGLIAYITAYRVLAVGLAGLCGAVIATIARTHAPEHGDAALVAWLWNPLLIVATAIGAHNDMLMVLGLLLALLLFQRQRWMWGLLALWLAIHVKITALIALPVLGLWLVWRCGWRRAIRSGLATLVLALPLSWLLYAPLGGWATLPRMLRERAPLLANSPAYLLYRFLREQAGWLHDDAVQAAATSATLLFGVIALLVFLLFRRAACCRPEQHTAASAAALLWRALTAVMLAFLLVGSYWFWSWYLVWLIAPAALLPVSRVTRLLLPAYCWGALSGNLAWQFLATQPRLTGTHIAWITVIITTVPLAGAAALLPIWRARAAVLPRTGARTRYGTNN